MIQLGEPLHVFTILIAVNMQLTSKGKHSVSLLNQGSDVKYS